MHGLHRKHHTCAQTGSHPLRRSQALVCALFCLLTTCCARTPTCRSLQPVVKKAYGSATRRLGLRQVPVLAACSKSLSPAGRSRKLPKIRKKLCLGLQAGKEDLSGSRRFLTEICAQSASSAVSTQRSGLLTSKLWSCSKTLVWTAECRWSRSRVLSHGALWPVPGRAACRLLPLFVNK